MPGWVEAGMNVELREMHHNGVLKVDNIGGSIDNQRLSVARGHQKLEET